MRGIRGEQVRPGLVHVRNPTVTVPLSAIFLSWLARKVGAGLVWLVKHPVLVAGLTTVVVLWRLLAGVGVWTLLGIVAVVLAGLTGWRLGHVASFRRRVAWPLRAAWRRVWVYRRGWQPAMLTTGLGERLDGTEFLPKLLRVRSTATVDRVTVRMLPGQVVDDYAAVTDRLARTFGAADCRVRTDPKRRGRVVLWLLIQDPLTDPVQPFEPATSPDLAGLEVALGEDAQTYRLRLLGTHLLVAGATGSGKGSVLWSIVAALQHPLRSGLVQLWVLDPKGGMEFAFGRSLFTRFCYGDPDPDEPIEDKAYELGYARLLEDAVEVMRDRQQRLRGQTRLHTPTVAEPLVVVVIDELASLTAYVTDRDAKKRIGSALALLLSQGRAVGVTVVGALQDPRKDVLPFRDLFPTRICLRVTEDEHVDMVLGPGARSRGARCDSIPETLPGVGYVGLDGVAEPIRVRFSHITDTHILDLAHTHGSTGRVRPVEGDHHDGPVAA